LAWEFDLELFCGRVNLLLGKAQHEREQMETKENLELVNMMGDHLRINVGNVSLNITPKQFAQLSEQVFQYWRVEKEQIFKLSTATDGQAHFDRLHGKEVE
jgi:hypothetical protein